MLPGFLPLFFGGDLDLAGDGDFFVVFLVVAFLAGAFFFVAGDLDLERDLDLAFLAGCFLDGDLLADLDGDFEAVRFAGDFEREGERDLAFLAGCFLDGDLLADLAGDLLVDLAGDLEVERGLAGDLERDLDLLDG